MGLPLNVNDLEKVLAYQATHSYINVEDANDARKAPERTYELDDSLTVTVRLDGEAGEGWELVSARASDVVRVPDAIDGKPVVALAAGAFKNQTRLTELYLPDSILRIGLNAFAQCSRLKTLRLPSEVSHLDTFVLNGCNAIETLVLPNAVEELPLGLFDAPTLRRLTIGRNTRVIPSGLFARCTLDELAVAPGNEHLSTDGTLLMSGDGTRVIACPVRRETVTVPAGAKVIAHKAFAYREDLRSICLPETLEAIESYAFFNAGLEAFRAPASLRRIDAKAFLNCHQLASVQLNDGLEEVGDEAFKGTAVAALDIPRTVRALGRRVAAGADLTYAGEDPTFRIDAENPMYRLAADGALYRTEGHRCEIVECLDRSIVRCNVAAGTTHVGEGAFRDLPSLEAVALPEGVIDVGAMAFRGCRRLTSVELADTVQSIGAQAFLDSGVESLRLPRALASLGHLALVTRGGNRAVTAPPLRRLSLAEGNEAFYVENGFLCQRRPTIGTDSAVIYADEGDCVEVPAAVGALEDYCLAGVTHVKVLKLHGNIENLGTCALDLGAMPREVVFGLNPAIDGRSVFALHPPRVPGAERILQLATHGRAVDPALFADTCDFFSLQDGDVADRARYCLERLGDPLFLSESYRERFNRFLDANIVAICCAFAARDDRRGLDALFDGGHLAGEVAVAAIDAVQAAGHVEMTAHMLERKNASRDGFSIDFDL